MIREVHAASYGNYGAKRVHAELVLGRGIRVGHNAVAMLMQRACIAGRSGARSSRSEAVTQARRPEGGQAREAGEGRQGEEGGRAEVGPQEGSRRLVLSRRSLAL